VKQNTVSLYDSHTQLPGWNAKLREQLRDRGDGDFKLSWTED
jgi:hypothetical protein